MKKQIGLLAAAIPFWFLLVYLVLSSLRPEYSHLYKAISELGSLDAPHRWYWNILGYILCGLAIAALGVGLNREFTTSSKIPGHALTLSGLFMSLSGIFPADMDDRTSLTTILHAIGSAGGFIPFLIAGFWYPFIFRAHVAWRPLAWPSLALVVLSIATGFLRSGNAPGLGQRVTFTCFFLWIFLIGYWLYRNNRHAGSALAQSAHP